MPKAVAVVEKFTQSMHDVREHAERQHHELVQTYRRGVETMARTGGTLPPNEADALLAAARTLGISPDRMSDDAAVFMHIANLQSRIDAIEARNVERRAPLAQLQSNLDAARAEWARVKPECDRRLAEAQVAVTAADQALARVANQRDERADNEQQQIRQLRDRHPHLFATLTADEMRRYLAPAQPIRLL